MSFTAVGTQVHGSVASGTSVTASISPASIGNYFFLIAVGSAGGAGVAPTSVSGGNCTWTQVGTNFTNSTHHTPTGATFNGWLGKATGTGSSTVTVNFAGSVGVGQLSAQQFSSTLPPVLDQQAGLDLTTGSTMPSLTPSAGAGEFYIGYDFDQGTAVQGSTSGYVYQIDSSSNGVVYNVNCGAGAQAPTFADSGVTSGIAFLLTNGVVEDAATPAPQSPVNAASGVATSNSFTPPSGTYVVVNVSWLFTNNATATLTCKDSAGTSYTSLAQKQDGQGATINAIFGHYYASSPGSITAKVTCSNTGSAGAVLAPRVLDGAASDQTGAASTTATGSSATWTASLTTTTTGSMVYVVAGATSTETLTATGGNTTLINAVNSGTFGDSGANGKSTATTTVPGPTTFGFSSTASESWGLAAVEIIPAAGGGGAPSVPVYSDPSAVAPGPAWGNQFGTLSCSRKRSVLWDVQLTFNGNFATAGDLAFNATSHGFQTIIVSDPPVFLPGPAWRNQFQTFTPKQKVLTDRSPPFVAGNYVSAGDIAFGANSAGSVAPGNSDRNQSAFGPAFLNQFAQDRLTKYAVLFDYRNQRSGRYQSAGDIAFGGTSLGIVTISGIVSPILAAPGPAWQNQFGPLSKKIKRAVPFQINYIPPPFGPFCLAGSEVDTNVLGGSAVDANFGLGGSETDANLFGGTQSSGCPPQNINISLGEFNDEVIDLTITNNGSPFNLTAYTVQALFKTAAGVPDTDPSTLVISTTTGGIVITSAPAGTAVLTIPNADLQATNYAFWRVDVVINGNQATAIYGNVSIRSL